MDQVRVVETVLNRAKHIPRYGGDVCVAAFSPAQYSSKLIPLHTPQDAAAWAVAQQATRTALILQAKGVDLSHGAVYFHNWHELGDRPRYHRKLLYKGKSHVWY